MAWSLSFSHISSTARLVYDIITTVLPSSASSSCNVVNMPYDVFPVPGGPMIRKKSRARLTLSASALNAP